MYHQRYLMLEKSLHNTIQYEILRENQGLLTFHSDSWAQISQHKWDYLQSTRLTPRKHLIRYITLPTQIHLDNSVPERIPLHSSHPLQAAAKYQPARQTIKHMKQKISQS